MSILGFNFSLDTAFASSVDLSLFSGTTTNPTKNTSWYGSEFPGLPSASSTSFTCPVVTDKNAGIVSPLTGYITRVSVNLSNLGTFPTQQQGGLGLCVNGTYVGTMGSVSAITWGPSPYRWFGYAFDSTQLTPVSGTSMYVTKGDTIQIMLNNPNWTTAPTNSGFNINFSIDDASTSTVSSIYYIDNPSGDLFYGFCLFFISMLFPIWFFKRKTKK